MPNSGQLGLRGRPGSTLNTPNSGRVEFVTRTEMKGMLDDLRDDIIRSFTGQFESFSKKMDYLERRIDIFEDRIAPLQAEQEKQATELARLKDEIQQIRSYATHELVGEFQERQKRIKNIVLAGVIEAENGNLYERQVYDKREVEGVLHSMGLAGAPFKEIMHFGRPQSGKARFLRVTLHDEELKVKTLKSARLLRSSRDHKKVFVNPDRTPSEQANFWDMKKKVSEMKSQGHEVVFIVQG